MNTQTLSAIVILMCIGLVTIEAKKVSNALQPPVLSVEEPPLIHDYLKLAFWFITGIIVGVYFEARLSFKNLVSPVLKYAITGFLLAVGILIMFYFATFVNKFLQ